MGHPAQTGRRDEGGPNGRDTLINSKGLRSSHRWGGVQRPGPSLGEGRGDPSRALQPRDHERAELEDAINRRFLAYLPLRSLESLERVQRVPCDQPLGCLIPLMSVGHANGSASLPFARGLGSLRDKTRHISGRLLFGPSPDPIHVSRMCSEGLYARSGRGVILRD